MPQKRLSIILGASLILIFALAGFGQETEADLLSNAFTKTLAGDIDGAIADCTAAIKINPNSDRAYNQRANNRMAKGDLAGAIADYTAAINLMPKNAVYYRNRGSAYGKSGDLKMAFEDYDKALSINPTSRYNDSIYLNRGRLKAGAKDYEGAIADYGKALEFNPAMESAYVARAAAYRKLGKTALSDADEKRADEERQKLLDGMKKP